MLALAFRDTGLIWGISLFTLIISIGLVIRFYLEHLRLLLVPRLSAILTVVIMLMAVISIISHKMGLDQGLSIALFPIVILSMMIERMCVMWEERGAKETLRTGAGSILAASIAYLFMHNAAIDYLLFAFPELLFVLLAIILIFSQYRGYRLSELIRFKTLAQ